MALFHRIIQMYMSLLLSIQCNYSETIFDAAGTLEIVISHIISSHFRLPINVNVNPLTTNVPYHIEASQFICNANHLTGFYMMRNIGR